MGVAVAAVLLLVQAVAPPSVAQPARAIAPAGGRIAAVQAAAGLRPLSASGAADAFRFTDIAPAGRGATIFEGRRTGAGIERTIVTLAPVQAGWTVESRTTKRLAGETFDYLSGRIDAAIAAGAPNATPCADGSDYLSERLSAGTVRTLAGACGDDHPNIAIARLLGVREEE